MILIQSLRTLVIFLLTAKPFFKSLLLGCVVSVEPKVEGQVRVNQTFRPGEELQNLKRIRAHLRKINKPFIKTIQSSDSDLIDCVPSHQQPAFDHPQLQGHKPLDLPERPNGHKPKGAVFESFQLEKASGESCLEGIIPIRRIKEDDILIATFVEKFGRKLKPVRHDSSNTNHKVLMHTMTRQSIVPHSELSQQICELLSLGGRVVAFGTVLVDREGVPKNAYKIVVDDIYDRSVELFGVSEKIFDDIEGGHAVHWLKALTHLA